MARKVFFSFEYEHDVSRAMVVRKSWVTKTKQAANVIDAVAFEAVKQKGDAKIKEWIDRQLHGTSVTVVLVGAHTCESKFVKYEIEQSIARGNGILQIDISGIANLDGQRSCCCGSMCHAPLYNWMFNDGYNNLALWVEIAYVWTEMTGQS